MEVNGKKVKLSIWVRARYAIQGPSTETNGLVVFTGHGRSRTIPHNHIIILPRCPGNYFG
jgi:hypothetical protein